MGNNSPSQQEIESKLAGQQSVELVYIPGGKVVHADQFDRRTGMLHVREFFFWHPISSFEMPNKNRAYAQRPQR